MSIVVRKIECVSYAPVLSASDYVEMLERTGFRVKVYGGYDERPYDGAGNVICLVAEKHIASS